MWFATITVLSVIPTSGLDYDVSDKLVHFVFYFTSVVLLYLSVRNRTTRSVVLIALGAFMYGFLIEVIQYFLPYRSFSLYDQMANGLGALSSAVIISLIRLRG